MRALFGDREFSACFAQVCRENGILSGTALVERISWLCLLAICCVALVFPDVFLKMGVMLFPSDDGTHTPHWVFFMLMSAIGFAALMVSGGLARVRSSPMAVPLAVLAVATVLLTVVAFRVPAAVWNAMKMLSGVGAAVLAIAWLGSSRRLHAFTWLLMAVSLLVAAYGFFQYLGFDSFRWAHGFGGNRVFSTLGNPNYLGGHYTPLVPLAALLFVTARTRGATFMWLVLFVLWFMLVLITQTRGAWIACVVAMGWLVIAEWKRDRQALIAKRGWLAALGLVTLFSAAIATVNNQDLAYRITDTIPSDFGQVAKRYTAMKGALLSWRDHPFAGVGPGCISHGFGAHMASSIPWNEPIVLADRVVMKIFETLSGAVPGSEEKQFVHTFSEESTHCDYIEVLGEQGVIGGGIFVWVLVTAVRLLLIARATRPILAGGLLAGGIGLGVHALANLPMNIAPTASLLWIGVGIAGSLRGSGAVGPKSETIAVSPSGGPGMVPRMGGPCAVAGAVVLVFATGVAAATIYAASVYSRAARIYMEGGDWVNAHALFERSEKVNWDDRREHFFIASALFQRGKHLESIAVFETELELNPYYMDGHTNLGSALGIVGNVVGAEKRFRRAIELNPSYAEAHANLGVALLEQERFDEAAAVFRRALELDPVLALAQNGLARARARSGR